MSTQVETKVTVVIQPEITKAVENVVKQANKAEGFNLKLAETVRNVANRHGWEQTDARQALVLSYLELYGLPTQKEEILESDSAEVTQAKREANTKLADFLKARASDFSRVMVLAYPSESTEDGKPSAKDELEKVKEHNRKLGENTLKGRIGLNRMYEVARGNLTYDEIINPKRPIATATPPTDVAASTPMAPAASASTASVSEGENNGDQTNPVATLQSQSQTTEAQPQTTEKLSPLELFECAAIAGKKNGLTFDQALNAIRQVFES